MINVVSTLGVWWFVNLTLWLWQNYTFIIFMFILSFFLSVFIGTMHHSHNHTTQQFFLFRSSFERTMMVVHCYQQRIFACASFRSLFSVKNHCNKLICICASNLMPNFFLWRNPCRSVISQRLFGHKPKTFRS